MKVSKFGRASKINCFCSSVNLLLSFKIVSENLSILLSSVLKVPILSVADFIWLEFFTTNSLSSTKSIIPSLLLTKSASSLEIFFLCQSVHSLKGLL